MVSKDLLMTTLLITLWPLSPPIIPSSFLVCHFIPFRIFPRLLTVLKISTPSKWGNHCGKKKKKIKHLNLKYIANYGENYCTPNSFLASFMSFPENPLFLNLSFKCLTRLSCLSWPYPKCFPFSKSSRNIFSLSHFPYSPAFFSPSLSLSPLFLFLSPGHYPPIKLAYIEFLFYP